MPKAKTVNFALLGLGKLGFGFFQIFREKQDKIFKETGFRLHLSKILVKNKHFKRPHLVEPGLITTELNDILNDPSIHVAIDAIGGIEPTFSIIKKLIASGKHIISANRTLLASKMQELADLSNKEGVHILPEPSLGGGLPIISSLKQDLVANEIKSLYAVVSGTSNFILSEMTKYHIPLKEVLRSKEMQKMSETLSVIDYEGSDAAQKAAIFASAAFGLKLNYLSLFSEGIADISVFDIDCAHEFGYEIKQLAIIKDHGDRVEIHIHPTLIPKEHPLTSIRGEYNAFFVQTDLLGNYLTYGRGLGVEPTSSLILRDLVLVGELIRKSAARKFSYRISWNEKPLMPMEEIISDYYIRFPCEDKPGVVGKITTIIGNQGINLSSAHAEVNKKKYPDIGFVHILIDQAREYQVMQSIHEIEELHLLRGPVKLLRIL